MPIPLEEKIPCIWVRKTFSRIIDAIYAPAPSQEP